MPEHRTHSHQINSHPIISFTLDDDFSLDPRWLLTFFEAEIQKGRQFADNETVQIGWMIVKFQSNTSGDLEIWEPQFDSFPIQWIKGANNTFRHLILQKSVCEQFACEPDFPSLEQAGIVSPRFLVHQDGFSMSRDQPANSDSGWVFVAPSEIGEEGEFRSLFEICFYHTEIIAFLALPVGTSVKKTKGFLEVEVNSRILSSKDNDLLRKLSESPNIV